MKTSNSLPPAVGQAARLYSFTPQGKHFAAELLLDGGRLIATFSNRGKRRTNERAAFIVHACNTSAANEDRIAALTAALEDALPALEAREMQSAFLSEELGNHSLEVSRLQAARAALALAKQS